MNQQCLECGNYAEGKVVMTLSRKLTRSAFQEGGVKVVGGVFTLFLGSGAIGVLPLVFWLILFLVIRLMKWHLLSKALSFMKQNMNLRVLFVAINGRKRKFRKIH